jgi:hypothetical protein
MALRTIPTGFICDALNGYAALDPSIKPLSIPGKKVKQIVGPALTVFSGAADVLGNGYCTKRNRTR